MTCQGLKKLRNLITIQVGRKVCVVVTSARLGETLDLHLIGMQACARLKNDSCQWIKFPLFMLLMLSEERASNWAAVSLHELVDSC